MQSIVRKAVRPFTVVLKGIILTLIICATGQVWAGITKTIAANTFIDGTKRVAYDVSGEEGFSLADIGVKYFPRVRFDGGSIDYDGIEAYVCNRYPATGDSDGKVRYEAQFVDKTTKDKDKWLKCAIFEFSLDGNNLMVQWKAARYARAADHNVGERFMNDDGSNTSIVYGSINNTSGYGIRDLRLVEIPKSININFTYNNVNVAGDYLLGASGYGVQASKWNNYQIGSCVGSTVEKTTVVDNSGTAISGAKVTVGDTSGPWYAQNNSAAIHGASDLRYGYMDDNSGTGSNPYVQISGIPNSFDAYRAIIYFHNDTDGNKFGYITVNDEVNLKGANGSTVVGEDAWGTADCGLTTEGGNYLVTPVLSNTTGTIKIKGHARYEGDAWQYRSGIAAIQIVNVHLWIGGAWTSGSAPTCGDAVIYVNGDTTVTLQENVSLNEVIVMGTGTLTISGATLTANKLCIESGAAVNMVSANIDATTITGAGTAIYTGVLPATDKGWSSATWTGTVWIKGVNVTSFAADNYGNSNSKLKLSGVAGYFPETHTCQVPIELSNSGYNFGLRVNNGWSRSASSDKIIKINKLMGNGAFWSDTAATEVAFHVVDWSEYTGSLQFVNKTMFLGETVPSYTEWHQSGSIFICEGATVRIASGVQWRADGGIIVAGELQADNVRSGAGNSFYDGNSTITTRNTGVFTLCTPSGTVDDQSVSYARIKGTGTLRYADGGNDNWRTLSQTSFPTGLICENNLTAGLILKTAEGDHTIGSLAGSGKIRSDWGNGNRNLKILQAKDTTYSGVFHATDRIGTVTVAPGDSTAGTLTLTGVQTVSNDLSVESGATVKVTGTWKGATTVAGSLAFGGAGKVDGAVTTSDGSTLDYTDATGTDHITGALTLNAGTTIKFSNGAKFPYKLAGSITYDGTEIAAAKYTIGGVAGTYPLSVNATTGEIDIKASASISESGETISWSNLSWTASESDGLTIAANESRTLALGSATAGRITFNVAANKTLTLTGTIEADEICVTGEGVVHCSNANTLQGVITGGGTVEYPEHVLPTMADWTSEDWEGTLILRNCGREQNVNYPSGETHGVVRFDLYGSAKSVIRAPGYKGISAVADQNTTCPATLFIDAGETVEFNHGTGTSALNTHGAGFRFAKLTGTGTLRLDGTSDTAQYIFDDVKGFAGTVEITFPETGGRKSFLFGAPSGWDVMNYAYAANLVILDDMTVAAGKTWDIPAGIIIGKGKTLTLGNGATVKALSKDTEGTIAVPAGTSEVPVSATLQGISNAVVNAKLTIGDNATLNITDPSLTTLTIPADSVGGTYVNAGTLNLSGCTSLTTLHLALGEAKTFDLSKVTLPSTCTKIYYDIGSKRDLSGYTLPSSSGGIAYYYYATETIEEYANSDSAGFTATNVPDGADVYLIRQNGTLLKANVNGTSRTYTGGRSFAGAACWHEWDFEQDIVGNRLNDTGRFFVNSQADAVTLSTVTSPAGSDYETVRIDVQKENKCVLSSYVYPYAAIAFGTTWSAALRCSLPTVTGDGKVVAIAFGDTTSGVLGLAAGADGFMELFTWASDTYTVLAQLQVESPSDKDNMHIYVFTVNNGTVSFYRDGEFIHTAAFTLPSNITKFMVGDVVNRGAAQGLPSAVASGGYIDYIRLYDKILPEADITGLSVRRPFVSAIDMYERTASLFEDWSATDAWTKKVKNNGGTTLASKPDNNANVTLKAAGALDINLNIDSNAHYGTLIFDGSGAVDLDEVGLYQTSNGCVSAEMFVVRRGVDLTVDYDAVNLSGAVVGVAQGAVLAFNFANYPFDAVTAVTTITLAGNVRAVLYDNTCKNRFSVILPDSLPAHITSAVASWDGTSYKITITPNHTAGGSVYYKDGALAAGMTVYTDAALTTATKLFAGDTLVISSASSTGDVSVDDSFNANISVTRSTVSLTSTGTAALAGKTVTVAENCTLNFAGGEFGAMTLAGAGSFAVTDDTAVTSLTGSVGVNVPSGVTLTLGAVTPFVTGGVTGSGTVKLPAHSGSTGFQFNDYGSSDGTIAVSNFSDYLISSDGYEAASILPSLRLDGDMSISALSKWNYSFAKITGTGNLTIPSSDSEHTPKSFTIAELADYDGKLINNNTSCQVTITKLIKSGVYRGGDVLLTKDGSGTVTISSVEVDGVAKQGEWFGNDFCLVAAEYNGTKYKTVAAAISAAGDANIGDITIFDTLETLPAGYRYVEGETTTVEKRPFALVVSGTPAYYDVARDVVIAAALASPPYGSGYDYIDVRVGGNVDIPLLANGLKIRNTGGADINFTELSDEYEPNPVEGDDYITYNVTEKPTIYTWTGAAFNSITGDADLRWEAIGNWSYVDSDIKTQTASRQPQAGDTVLFNSAAKGVTIGSNTSVAAIRVGAAVSISKAQSSAVTLTATTENGIVLTDRRASITVTGVTISPEPTTNVPDAEIGKVTEANVTTYTVINTYVAMVGEKKYEKLTDAIVDAGDDDIVYLLGDATLDLSRNGNVLGGPGVTKITINGNGNTLTFVRSETWAQVNTANNASLVLENVVLAAENSNPYSKTQYTNLLENPNHNIAFNCVVELNNVTSTTALSFFKNATLDTVTIAETVDVYSIWIHTSASSISIKDLVVNSPAGRGIKVDDTFVSPWGGTPAATSLGIAGATFTTKNKKAAVLINSNYATTVEAFGVNIAGVPADTTNLVWVDESSATNFGLVTVTGANIGVEPIDGDYAATLSTGNKVDGYYKTLGASIEKVGEDQTITLLKNVSEATSVSKAITIDLNGNTLSGSIVLTAKEASVIVSGGTLPPLPTQTYDVKAKVLAVDNGDGSTTYKVVYGTIFSVW